MHGRIARDHVARDPAEQHRAEPDQDRKAVEHHHDQRGAGDDHGNADGKAEDQQRELTVRGGRDRDDVVEAHDDVGDHDDPDRMPEAGARGDVVAFVFGHQKLGGDHRAARGRRPASDRAAPSASATMPVKAISSTTAMPAPITMPHRRCRRVQAAAGHRDHQRIVAGQQHVDPDDLADREPERRSFAGRPEIARKTRRYWRDQRPATASSQPTPLAQAAVLRCRRSTRLARRRLRADQPTISLPEKNWAISIAAVSGGIRTMHRVLADRLRMQLADRAVGRLGRIGRAHDVAVFEHGVFAFENLNDHRGRRS